MAGNTQRQAGIHELQPLNRRGGGVDGEPLNEQYSHESGSIFFEEGQELPNYHTEVADIEELKAKTSECDYGELKLDKVRMSNGTIYEVLRAEPNECNSDTAIASTTEWLTDLELEHHKKIVRGMLKLGYPVVFFGPPGLDSKQKHSRSEKLEAISLPHTAHNIHKALDEELPKLDVREGEIIWKAGSRGAMVGNGIMCPKYAGDRKVPYAELVDPCVPRQFLLKEAPRVVGQMVPEAFGLGKLAMESLFKGELHRYAKALPKYLRRDFFKNSADTLQILLSGHAGQLAEASDPDSHVHISIFKDSYWAQGKDLAKIVGHRETVEIEEIPGPHVFILKPKTRRDSYKRLQALRDIRGYDGSFDLGQAVYDEIKTAHLQQNMTEKAKEVGKAAVKKAA